MPKKTVEKSDTVLLENTGSGTKICNLPGGGIRGIVSGGTLELPKDIADFYISCGGWKKAKIKKEGDE
jgi:hypothetical protein